MSLPPYSQEPALVLRLDFTGQAERPLLGTKRAQPGTSSLVRVYEPDVGEKTMHVELCLHCGRSRHNFPGVHGPHGAGAPGVVVDCIGRRCVQDSRGYYQLEAVP